jgi:thiol-disulfide isomerase/thioredoxin
MMLNKFRNNYGYILLAIALLYAVGRYLYKKPSVINGESAPNFSAAQLNGEAFDLSKTRGQYILLDFWGSWCGPCVEEVPKLKSLYQKFHGKPFKDATNFNIVSFGVEKSQERWAAAAQQLGMSEWINVSDLQNLESPIAKLYGVRVIPTKFLLNTEGVIIGVNLSDEEIDKILSEKVR